jgi:hypothetical protein
MIPLSLALAVLTTGAAYGGLASPRRGADAEAVAAIPVGTTPDGSSQSCGPAAAARAAAIETFWRVFHDNDYTHIEDAQAALQRGLAANPDDGTLHALLAATHWWHVGESARDPSPDPQVLSRDLPTALQLVEEAVKLDPDDDHLPGFAGTLMVHLGRFAQDAILVANGDRTLAYSVYQFPEFNNFNRWAAHNADPKGSDGFRLALDSLWQAVDACAGETVDRHDPDLTRYMHLRTAVGRKKVCWDENPLAPHGFEGLMASLGNGLVKAGDVDAARIVYRNARLAAHYQDWPYRADLESILGSDLRARAALYDDADPSNDPPVTVRGRSCAYCHATGPER